MDFPILDNMAWQAFAVEQVPERAKLACWRSFSVAHPHSTTESCSQMRRIPGEGRSRCRYCSVDWSSQAIQNMESQSRRLAQILAAGNANRSYCAQRLILIRGAVFERYLALRLGRRTRNERLRVAAWREGLPPLFFHSTS